MCLFVYVSYKSGSISRGFRGEFRQFKIVPGLCEGSPVMANQFSIFISRDGGHKNYSSVLAPDKHEGIGKVGDQGISSWDWNLNGQHSTYHALFPRAWTIYDGINILFFYFPRSSFPSNPFCKLCWLVF
ncbi:uncharacterized protein LOC133785317 [Humulus lupulus]|uniref:uncharacterized protein LOC133785317 n=1 Tax=Humulus lupulus TaxID=3486 RepID=UPI002B4180F8|nr:uncharacterized protein LOC133785317 [Humulus lupulus]